MFTIPQELYEKSLLRVDDGTLCADLLEIRTFLTVPKVILSVRCCPLLFTNVTKALYVLLQNLVNVMTMCPRHDLVSFNFGIKIGFRNKHKVSLCFFFSSNQRTKGLKIFQLSIDKFDTEAKYKFFQ